MCIRDSLNVDITNAITLKLNKVSKENGNDSINIEEYNIDCSISIVLCNNEKELDQILK